MSTRPRKIILCSDVGSCRSPVLHQRAMLASSCCQLEAIGVSAPQQRSCTPEFPACLSTPSRQRVVPPSYAPPTASSTAASEQSGEQGSRPPLYCGRRAVKSEVDGEGVRKDSKGIQLMRSHSEPGLASSTDTGVSRTKISLILTAIFQCLLTVFISAIL